MFSVVLLCPWFGRAQNVWKDVYRESAWEARDKWQRPAEIVGRLALRAGDKVADVGCHEGYFTLKLAAEVGDAGRVYAVDIDRDKLDKLKGHLSERNITNVIIVKGDEDDPKLPVGALDAVLIVDTYHEMDAHDEILRRIKASLKHGGRLVICEPVSEASRKLTRADQEKKHELGMAYAIADLEKAGFKITFKKDPFVDRTQEKGDEMWIIVAEKH